MTYMQIIEKLCNAKSIKKEWNNIFPPNEYDQEFAGNKIKKYIEANGVLFTGSPTVPDSVYYKFHNINTDIPGLKRLYQFFFKPTIVKIQNYV